MYSWKQRITSGWNWVRIIYLILGLFVIIQSILIRQWVGMLLGLWFAVMGLFGLGCAGGNCYLNNSTQHPDSKNNFIAKETESVTPVSDESKVV